MDQTTQTPTPLIGCYGLTLSGLDDAKRYLRPAAPDWPEVSIRTVRPTQPQRPPFELDDDVALIHLSDGESWAELSREQRSITVHSEHDYPGEALLHPMLTGSLAVHNRWIGRDAFHGGAACLDNRAWAIVGDKDQGKSSTLASLAQLGVPIIADDLLVVSDGDLLAGPPFVDLRNGAATALSAGRSMGHVGTRERWRLDATEAPARTPLAGWIYLAWGDEVSITRVPLDEHLKSLFANQTVLLRPKDPSTFLNYAALPAFVLTRPRDWALHTTAIERLRRINGVLPATPSGPA